MAADDRKNNERIETKVTERVYIDFNRMAALQDRTAADLLRIIVREYLYGHCKQQDADINEDNSRN